MKEDQVKEDKTNTETDTKIDNETNNEINEINNEEMIKDLNIAEKTPTTTAADTPAPKIAPEDAEQTEETFVTNMTEKPSKDTNETVVEEKDVKTPNVPETKTTTTPGAEEIAPSTAESAVVTETKPEEKKKRYLLLLLLLFILIGAFLYTYHHTKDTDLRIPKAETATKIDDGMPNEELQKLLDQKVKDGMMNANYSIGASFKGVKSESFNIKNIPDNKHDIQFALFDENGNQLYQSGSIKRGYEVNEIELTKALSKGKHNCKIAIWYVENDKQLGNIKSTFPIELWFK